MSFTKGVSFHHETNAASQPTINNNISINTSNEVKTETGPNPYATEDKSELIYPPPPDQEEKSDLTHENMFLKRILEHYMNQKLYWSGKYLVLAPDELTELLAILLPGYAVDVVLDEFEVTCCGKPQDIPFAKVDAVWLTKDDVRVNLKYARSDIVSVFESYKISTKFVLVN